MAASHRAFSLDAPFVARRDFTRDGVEYKAGAPFPWRSLGVTERQLWTLWGARLVDNAPPARETPARETPAVAPPPPAHRPAAKHGRQARR